MKLSQILLEYQELNDNELQPIVRGSFQSVYPNAPVFFKRDEPNLTISTSKEKLNDPSSLFGMGGDDFYLALNAYVYKDTADVVVSAAWAGKYKGVTSVIIKNVFSKLKQLAPAAILTLIADDDRSDGAWERIASKIGVNFESQ